MSAPPDIHTTHARTILATLRLNADDDECLEAIVNTLGEVSTGARAQWGGEQSRLGGAAPGANLARGRGGRTRRGSGDAADAVAE